jgi:hypothetical protein
MPTHNARAVPTPPIRRRYNDTDIAAGQHAPPQDASRSKTL